MTRYIVLLYKHCAKISTIIRFKIKLKYQSRLMRYGYFIREYPFIYQKLVNLPNSKIEKHIT